MDVTYKLVISKEKYSVFGFDEKNIEIPHF